MTARLQLSIGCRQSVKLDNVTAKVRVDAGATDGSINVNARIWAGSTKVVALQRKFVEVNSAFKTQTLPWSEGVRIFRADRVHSIYQLVGDLIRSTDPLIEDIVKNYDTELEAAVTALGKEGNSENYPETGEAFRSGVVRRFNVDTIGSSNKLMEMVGGALGNHLAREHEEALRQSIGQAQQDAADRMIKVLERFVLVCDPNKAKTRITNSLFEDLQEITRGLNDLLLFPNQQLEMLNAQIQDTLGRMTRDDVAENPAIKAQAYHTAQQMVRTLSGLTIV